MRKSLDVFNTSTESHSPFEVSVNYDGLYIIKPDAFEAYNLIGRKSDWISADLDDYIIFDSEITPGTISLVSGDISNNSLRFHPFSDTGTIIGTKVSGLYASSDVYVSINTKLVAGSVAIIMGTYPADDSYGYAVLNASGEYELNTFKISGVDPDNFYITIIATAGTPEIYLDSIVVIDITSKPLSDYLKSVYSKTNYSELTLNELDEVFSGNVLSSLANEGYAIPEIGGNLLYTGDIYYDDAAYARTKYFFKDLSEIDINDITVSEVGDYINIFFGFSAIDVICAIDPHGRRARKVSSPTTTGVDYDSGTIQLSLLKDDFGISEVNKYNAKRLLNGFVNVGGVWKSPDGYGYSDYNSLVNPSSNPMLLLYEYEEKVFEVDAIINVQRESATITSSFASPALILEPIVSGYTSRNISQYGLRKIRHIITGDYINRRVTTIPYYWDYSEWDSSSWS